MAAGLRPDRGDRRPRQLARPRNARWGKSDYLVAEADESDGSFLTLTPTIAIVTNIDAEHLDHYGTYENVKKAFTDFCNRVPFFGMSALCLDNAGVQAILPNLTKRFATYGISPQATYRARNIRHDGLTTQFVAWRRADELGEVALPMPGAHNVLNALGVLAVADFLGDPVRDLRQGDRRSSKASRAASRCAARSAASPIVDDFGHHPAEVQRDAVGRARDFAGRRVVAAFQPHRFTRTRDQLAEFARAFHDADKVVDLRHLRRRREADRRRDERGARQARARRRPPRRHVRRRAARTSRAGSTARRSPATS